MASLSGSPTFVDSPRAGGTSVSGVVSAVSVVGVASVVGVVGAAELSPPLSSPPPPPPPLSVLGSTNSTSGSVISIGISSIGTSSTIISGVGKGAVVKSSSPMVSSIVAVPIKSGSASRETSSSS